MLTINVSSNVKEVQRKLSIIERQQIPFATAQALTRTAQAAQKEVIAEMARKFDRPRAYTLGGTYFVSATKKLVQGRTRQYLTATVGFKDATSKGTPAAKYLLAEIFGGVRRHKRFEMALIRAGIMRSNEYAVPGDDMRLDANGNISKGAITAMLSQVKANPDPLQNVTGSARSQRTRRGKGYYYNPSVRAIFVRTGRRAQQIFVKFVRVPRYRVRLPFYRIVSDVVQYQFNRRFKQALAAALRTAR